MPKRPVKQRFIAHLKLVLEAKTEREAWAIAEQVTTTATLFRGTRAADVAHVVEAEAFALTVAPKIAAELQDDGPRGEAERWRRWALHQENCDLCGRSIPPATSCDTAGDLLWARCHHTDPEGRKILEHYGEADVYPVNPNQPATGAYIGIDRLLGGKEVTP